MTKIFVVTGASSGIGQALCQQLLTSVADCKVYAVGRNRHSLKALCAGADTRLIPVVAELTTNMGRKHLKQQLLAEPRIEAIVHCAAVVTPLVPLAKVHVADWQTSMLTNVEAPVMVTQSLLPQLCESRVLFVTSEANITPVAGAGTYCISKHALHMAWQCWQQEIDPSVATFGLVSPGMVDTPMQEQIRNAREEDLPLVTAIRQLHTDGQLLVPTMVAKYLTWLITKVEHAEFGQKVWDIYNEADRQRWCDE